MHEIRVRNDYMGVLAEGPVSSISTDSRFGTLVGTILGLLVLSLFTTRFLGKFMM